MLSFKPLRMKSQLILGFSVMVAIIAVVVFINIMQVRTALELSQHITDIHTPTAKNSMTMLNGVNQALAALETWMLLGDAKFKKDRQKIWATQVEAPLKELEKLSINWLHVEYIEQLKKIKALLSQFKQFQEEIEEIAQSPDNIPALKLFFEQAVSLSNIMSNKITEMIDLELKEQANQERKMLLGMMADVRGTLGLSLANIRAFLLSGKNEFKNDFQKLWLKNETRFNELNTQKKLLTPEQLKAFELFSESRQRFMPLSTQILAMRDQRDWNRGNYWLATQATPVAAQLVEKLEELSSHQQRLSQEHGQQINSLIHNLIIIEWYLLGLAILLAIFFAWLISRHIFNQVGGEPFEIAQMTKCVAAGNLERAFESKRTQRTGIYASLQDMVQALKEIVKQAHRLAQGDYSVQIVPRSEKDILGKALFEMTKRLGDITTISEAIVAGDYSRQIDSKGNSDLLGLAINQMTRQLQQVTDESQKSDWLKTGQTELNEKMRGEQTVVSLTQNILTYIADYLHAQVGVFFLGEGDKFKLVSSYAYQQRKNNYNEFKLGEGLIGQAALEKKTLIFSQVPEEHINLSIHSGLGESKPHDILVLPLLYEEQVLGILELGTSRHFTATEMEWLNLVADNIAITLNSAQSRVRMQALLADSQQMTLTLQNRQEEILEREEHIRAIVDTVVDAIITIDEKGIIDSFNTAAEQIFGYSWSEVVDKNIKMLMPEPYHSEHDRYLLNYLQTGKPKIIGNPREAEGKRKDGSIFPLDLAVTEMLIGERRMFVGIIRDITERKKAEEVLRIQQEEVQSTNEELRAQQEALQSVNEELQTQQEELAASNKELQAQREELKFANANLEDKTEALEENKLVLEEKARALELSTRYKSEFLANMSHELRTPLNSLLILAQLLGDNKKGNLTEKQVEYAQTIHSAGSELLALINDILDLSKVEAGKMEVVAEDISLPECLEMIEQKFRHVAEQKGLAFTITISENIPSLLYTDLQRLKQILNNLLSNAFKFTSQGEIKLIVDSPVSPPKELLDSRQSAFIAIRVTDTGIGIPKEKQSLIFEAFKQVDGTTSRRYGGTGLGLSISRQLAQLLGGDLYLVSQEGYGSTFTLYLPETFEEALPEDSGIIVDNTVKGNETFNQPRLQITQDSITQESKIWPPASDVLAPEKTEESISPEIAPPIPPNEEEKLEPESIVDDRDKLTPNDKTLLIIEDDGKFSDILIELARDKGFKCLIATDGKTGLELAEQYPPHAIVLDIGLPQMDGWTVMDKLKDNPNTRHIPVHFMSASDQEMDAKKMGAIGYLLKPIDMKQLGEAFIKIERFISDNVKNVLIVADDKAHKKEILDIVGDGKIESTIAVSQKEALKQLKAGLFDCIILDLEVEQGSGLELLEQLRHEEKWCQIPVIIYAERDLKQEEEKLLQQYSDNLTVKAVRSPERLLDEATLFLHQVEAQLPNEKRDMLRMVHDKEAILRNQKILIVDDDARNVFALVTVLEDKDIEVIVGKTGYEGLELLDKHPDISLVLMDIMMPEMDGYEAIHRIRAQPRYHNLPIIALTAKAMKGDKAKCIEVGANDYLAKPVDTEKLISLMRVWLYR
jgi:PAS domain S-box-containing protein